MKITGFIVLGLIVLYGIASYIVYGIEQAIGGVFIISLITAITWSAWKITHRKPKTDKVKA